MRHEPSYRSSATSHPICQRAPASAPAPGSSRAEYLEGTGKAVSPGLLQTTPRDRISQHTAVTVTHCPTRGTQGTTSGASRQRLTQKNRQIQQKNLENRLVHSTWDPLQSPSLGKQLVLSSHLLCCHGLCVQFHQAAFVFFLKALLNISQWEGNLRAVT